MHLRTHGFSLIEVLVSITIFALIMAAVISNFRGGEWKNQLSLAAQNVASELRKTQTMTTAGQPTYVCKVGGVVSGNCEDDRAGCAGDCVEQVPAGGYGLALVEDSETILLFANIDASDEYDPADELVRDLRVSPTGRVKVDQIDVGGIAPSLQIIFHPPSGEISFGGPDVFGNPPEAHIWVSHLSSNETREIVINRISGRIDVREP